MGNQASAVVTMNAICSRLVDLLARLLEPDEAEAVRGDFIEAGDAASHALRDIAGLVVRRQAALWMTWRPWLSLLAVVGAVGVLLLRFWGWLSGLMTLRLLLYFYDGSTYESGLTLGQDIFAVTCQCLALASWLWTSGRVIGVISRRTAWVSWLIFTLLWWSPLTLHFIIGLPWHVEPGTMIWRRMFLALHGLLFLPLLVGLYLGCGARSLTRGAALAAAVWTLVISALAMWTRTWWDTAMAIWSKGALQPHSVTWQTWIMVVVLCWPVVYMVAIACSPRSHSHVAAG